LTTALIEESFSPVVIEAAIESRVIKHAPSLTAHPEKIATRRVSIACVDCHKRRIRCSGARPACKACLGSRIKCIYKEPAKQAPQIRPGTPTYASGRPSPTRAFSTAGSESSMGSHTSLRSWGSLMSVDSRGPRRGRKRWTRPPTPPSASRPKYSSPRREQSPRGQQSGDGRQDTVTVSSPFPISGPQCSYGTQNSFSRLIKMTLTIATSVLHLIVAKPFDIDLSGHDMRRRSTITPTIGYVVLIPRPSCVYRTASYAASVISCSAIYRNITSVAAPTKARTCVHLCAKTNYRSTSRAHTRQAKTRFPKTC